MMMRTGQALLLPANPWFIWGTLIGAMLLKMVLHVVFLGRAAWVPDLMAIAIAFWIVHQPLRLGVGSAFALGLLVDVHQGSLLGQHALSYAVLGYLAVIIHRRVLWFDLPQQALHVLPLFIVAHAIQWIARALSGDGWPGWLALLAPGLEALLWPVATLVLLAPQLRAHDPDENRPL